MRMSRWGTSVHVWAILLGVVALVGCSSVKVNYLFQMATRTSDGKYQLLMQGQDGSCEQTVVEYKTLVEVLSNPQHANNSRAWERLVRCSTEWDLPDSDSERTATFVVRGPESGQYRLLATAGAKHPSKQHHTVTQIELEVPRIAAGVQTTAGTSKAWVDGGQTVLISKDGEGYFLFRLVDLEMEDRSGQAVAEFQFLAANPGDVADRRLIVVMNGKLKMIPIRDVNK